jgi:antitoxin CcdA
MKSTQHGETRKRPVNLSLNEDLVLKARSLTNNLSGVVEALLTDYVAQQQQLRIAEARELEATVSMWNTFNAEQGSFADEYSSL